ncbi:MAG: hypothetical protein IJN59_00235 [Oscillospiraceae bacterium]|nr:hypothetical protein [Oscillospiraceae bacterium]
MVCENLFCIYQQEGECLLEEIQLDRAGVCTSCIYPSIDQTYLKQEKLKLLQKYQQEE